MSTILDLFRLDGKVALVTGASSGLGVGFARALADVGADVVLAARRTDRLQETREAIESMGRRALVVTTDVVDPEQCTDAVAATMAEFGRLDVLVNNAGVAESTPALRESPDQFRRVMDVNVNGSYWMAQACARVMQPGSAIVNLASVLAYTSVLMPQAAYSASKSAVVGLTRDLAQQWTPRKGIRVNALAPGYFESEMTGQFAEGVLDRYVVPRTLFGRLGNPGELDAALIFLASDASSYLSGVTLPVDGGMLTN
ncbi:MAG: glucose 1-dehydrogenase [Gordonia sp. (in: high G+C Gram-positive bacteria)]|uniref:SDR family NAD(P)-dependent oxidoreductase n=1 Tax=Gordonia sp. (in: high G+C Gram-positive bacteria) TaxID=84139 RepID=UPI003C70FD60